MRSLIDTYGMPSQAELVGHDGACRYISHESGKSVTAAQVKQLHAWGKNVVLNFEDSATNAQGGHGQGVADAQFAVAVAKQVGAPAGVGIPASVDYEVHAGTGAMFTVVAYFEGWTPILRAAGYLSGAYGTYDVVKTLLDGAHIDLAWQTSAWSYGNRDPRAVLFQDQYTNAFDVDEIEHPFYGAWTPAGAQPQGDDDLTPIQAQQLADIHAWLIGGTARGQKNEGSTIAASLSTLQGEFNKLNQLQADVTAIKTHLGV